MPNQSLAIEDQAARPLFHHSVQGAISEVFGAFSSGKTALVHSFLAQATSAGQCCAIVDVLNAFDPLSATQRGVDLHKLLWVRGTGREGDARASEVRVDHAFKCADLLLHGGGFGVVVLDLCDVAARDLNRIPLSYWYRFRLAVQNTPTRLIVAGDVPLVKSCARLQCEARRDFVGWRGPVFAGIESSIKPRNRQGVPWISTDVRVMPMAG
jgi:recA bacterial DNA recombination protein